MTKDTEQQRDCLNGNICFTCGSECIDKCSQCGAPQCCPKCCAETIREIKNTEHEQTYEDELAGIAAELNMRILQRDGSSYNKIHKSLEEAVECYRKWTALKPSNTSRKLSSYYFDFNSTGDDSIDAILEAIAQGARKFHHTRDWNEDRDDSVVGLIELAAFFAAKSIKSKLTDALNRGRIEGFNDARATINATGALIPVYRDIRDYEREINK